MFHAGLLRTFLLKGCKEICRGKLHTVKMMVDEHVKLYEELILNPAPVGAHCLHRGGTVEILTRWEQRDLQRLTKIKLHRSHFLAAADLSPVAATSPSEINNEQLRAYSHDGLKIAILRNMSYKTENDRQFIEIWEGNCKLKNYEVRTQEKHLQVLSDGQFSCLQWSPSGTHLLYVAEKYFNAESYFKQGSVAKNGEPEKAKKQVEKGEEFLYRQSWGEALQMIHHPIIFTLNVETGEVKAMPGIGDDISCGQAVWTPDGKGVVFVGWWHSPFRLGLIYCGNRRSAVFYSSFETNEAVIIGPSDCAVESPRFSNNGEILVFLTSLEGGPHKNVQTLMKCDWATKAVSTVVDCVASPVGNDFPGIYSMGLPRRVWSKDNERLIIHSIWRSKQELLCIDVNSGKVTRLTNDRKLGNWELLDCHNDLIVVSVASPNIRPYLAYGRLPATGNEFAINWRNLTEDDGKKIGISWETINLQPPSDAANPKYANLDYDAILITPSENSTGMPFRLIVFPHGGPHSTLTASYYMSVEFFTRLGFAVLFVNYRGSLGFGQDNINSLPGNIGKQDTKDVQFAVETALKTGIVDRNRIVLYGGSHGGFLVLSLSGLHPDFYKACVTRNPVVDVSGMLATTDIPDWNFVENGSSYAFTSLVNPDQLKSMWEKSPIRLADKIKIPVLFMLGNVDLRVPHHQGLMLHKALKARGIDTRVYVYNDNHSLSKVESESDSLIHAVAWMLKHTS